MIQVSKLIEYHDININSLTEEKLTALLELFTREELIMLFQLKKADLLSQNTKYHNLLVSYKEQQKHVLRMKEIL